MAIAPELNNERLSAMSRLGTIENIQASAELAATSSITTPEQLQEFLQTNYVPESLAYFIFDYQTIENRKFWVPEKTAIIDTRGLTSYQPGWPVFEAEYHYEPARRNNYIAVYGRPYPREEPRWNYGYHMRIPITNALELDTTATLESYSYLGDAHNPIEMNIFRTSAHPEYKKERNPENFIEVLYEVADGLKKYLYLRDYL